MKRDQLRKMILAGIFTAIILVLGLPPMCTVLGFIKIGPLSITSLVIPVVIGAIILGPYYGMFLGFMFGMMSFIQCFTVDPFGASLLAISPILTFVVCVIPRVLVGLVPALLFRLIMKRPTNSRSVAVFVSAIAGSLTNTVLFLGFLGLIFGQTKPVQDLLEPMGAKSVLHLLIIMAGVNALLEAVAVAVIAPPVYFALQPHKKIVGIDLGASGTKIVMMKGGKLLKSTMKKPEETLEAALDRFGPEDADCITVTGVGASALPETLLGKKVVKVDEFASLYRGASTASKRINMVVASVGTGTAFVRVTPFGAWHLGGSGVGGGMLEGMSKKLFGSFDPETLQKLASEGKAENCDLLIKDVTEGQIGNLTPETTVANLKKAGDADDASLARGIYTLIFQCIGVMGAFCTKAHLTRTVVVCGTILDSQPIAKEMLDGIAKLHKVRFIIPANAAYVTAIGSTRFVQD
ncbi:MAG: ECF transporter S component [Clostridia bacterium]|nr:ECF transporter S component [Clostridia bacterium]